MRKAIYLSLALISLALLNVSCNNEDAPLPDNTINFSTSELGIDETETTKSFTVAIDRAADVEVAAVFDVVLSDVIYGTDFTTAPVITDNKLTVIIPAGETSATVVVSKNGNSLFDGDETITFILSSVSGNIVVGTKTSLIHTFGAIVSEGSTLTLNGGEGGSGAKNSVFVDFSNNEQTAIVRTAWSLGFYCGESFAVKLNNTTASAAIQSNLALTDVISGTDSATYVSQLTIGRESASFDVIDDINGDLSKTIIKENNVYLVCLGTTAIGESTLYKVKVAQTTNGYSLQYAASGSANVNTVEINKNDEYNFIYYSFGSNSVVNVEPIKTKWDFRWSYQTYTAGIRPYTFSDFVTINYLGGVTAAEVLGDNTAYAAFNSNSLASVEFSSDINTIGGNWRVTAGTNLGIKSDRFYVIKDALGNVYKLRFLKMGVGSDGGTRGYPEIEYALVQ